MFEIIKKTNPQNAPNMQHKHAVTQVVVPILCSTFVTIPFPHFGLLNKIKTIKP